MKTILGVLALVLLINGLNAYTQSINTTQFAAENIYAQNPCQNIYGQPCSTSYGFQVQQAPLPYSFSSGYPSYHGYGTVQSQAMTQLPIQGQQIPVQQMALQSLPIQQLPYIYPTQRQSVTSQSYSMPLVGQPLQHQQSAQMVMPQVNPVAQQTYQTLPVQSVQQAYGYTAPLPLQFPNVNPCGSFTAGQFGASPCGQAQPFSTHVCQSQLFKNSPYCY